MLSSSNCFIVSGIPMFVLLARTYLCRGDNLLRCSYLMCLRKSFVSLKRKPNTVGQDTKKVLLFPPFPPIRGHVQLASQNTSHFKMPAHRELSPLPNSGRLFRTSGHALEVVIFVTPVRAFQKTGRALHAQLLLHASHQIPYTSHLLLPSICIDTFCGS